ncbi:unnamed protein product [Mycena citricolor]|uniref:P-loop containing nucleoside triphosphate hydrolase protein n=1 Tax=Mycena citricolor TaxID=2018698 RepID=A0AAD2GZT0_9AGAR|nr:unnamed protein product [Mycena citricolor]
MPAIRGRGSAGSRDVDGNGHGKNEQSTPTRPVCVGLLLFASLHAPTDTPCSLPFHTHHTTFFAPLPTTYSEPKTHFPGQQHGMDTLRTLVGGSSVVDGMKLVVLGGTVETARRMSSSAWSHFVNSFFLTAHFSEEDHPYDWLMLWLSRRPEWQRSREFETTTRAAHAGQAGWEEEDITSSSYFDPSPSSSSVSTPSPPSKTRVIFQPTFDSTHTIFWRGHWLRVKRGRGTDGGEVLSVSVVARSNDVLKALVMVAKREYEAEAVHRIQIFFADPHGSWRWADARHKRPMGSIVLDPGVKEMLLGDARDFLASEKWYADRGIPFRRGYLLHGVPGSGKSSLIHAIAGELMLDVYVVSLSSAWISDSVLMSLMGRVPKGAILLLEDLDAAFTRSVSRTDSGDGQGEGPELPAGSKRRARAEAANAANASNTMSDLNTLSLSGLLNALDGVAAAEGRILFATTNHLEKLDPALSRPGRMDVWVEFRNASRWQAEALFRNFFPEEEPAASDSEDDIVLDGSALGTNMRSASSTSLWSDTSFFSSSSSSTPSIPSTPSTDPSVPGLPQFGSSNKTFLPPPVAPEILAAQHSARPLDSRTLAVLARTFAEAVPEGEFSVAALQGYLLKNKSRPAAAANEAAAWVAGEREMRERMAREKEAREGREREEREKRRAKKAARKLKKKADATAAAATATTAGAPAAASPTVTAPVPAVPTALPAPTPATVATTAPGPPAPETTAPIFVLEPTAAAPVAGPPQVAPPVLAQAPAVLPSAAALPIPDPTPPAAVPFHDALPQVSTSFSASPPMTIKEDQNRVHSVLNADILLAIFREVLAEKDAGGSFVLLPLLLVCRSWYTLLASQTISNIWYRTCPARNPKRLQNMLRLSNTALLLFQIAVYCDDAEGRSEGRWDDRMMNMIVPASIRVQELVITGSTELGTGFLSMLAPRPFLSLKVFCAFFAGRAPALQNLTVECARILDSRHEMRSLTRLVLSGSAPQRIFRMLSALEACPALVKLRLNLNVVDAIGQPRSAPVQSRVHLLHLKHCSITGLAHICAMFLSRVVVPPTARLHVLAPRIPGEDGNDVLDIMDAFGRLVGDVLAPPLESLRICALTQRGPDLQPWMPDPTDKFGLVLAMRETAERLSPPNFSSTRFRFRVQFQTIEKTDAGRVVRQFVDAVTGMHITMLDARCTYPAIPASTWETVFSSLDNLNWLLFVCNYTAIEICAAIRDSLVRGLRVLPSLGRILLEPWKDRRNFAPQSVLAAVGGMLAGLDRQGRRPNVLEPVDCPQRPRAGWSTPPPWGVDFDEISDLVGVLLRLGKPWNPRKIREEWLETEREAEEDSISGFSALSVSFRESRLSP